MPAFVAPVPKSVGREIWGRERNPPLPVKESAAWESNPALRCVRPAPSPAGSPRMVEAGDGVAPSNEPPGSRVMSPVGPSGLFPQLFKSCKEKLVPGERLELTWSVDPRVLRPLRLPIPPSGC